MTCVERAGRFYPPFGSSHVAHPVRESLVRAVTRPHGAPHGAAEASAGDDPVQTPVVRQRHFFFMRSQLCGISAGDEISALVTTFKVSRDGDAGKETKVRWSTILFRFLLSDRERFA